MVAANCLLRHPNCRANQSNNIYYFHNVYTIKIVDDALALARSGHSTFPRAFQVMEYLKHETDPLPWFSAINHLNFLLTRYTPDQDTNFKVFIRCCLISITHITFPSIYILESYCQIDSPRLSSRCACQ